MLDYFHCLPGDSIPYNGYDCEQIIRDIFRDYQAQFMHNRFGTHPALKLEHESSLSHLLTPKRQLILEDQPTGRTTAKLPSPIQPQQQITVKSAVPLAVKKERLRDSSISSISSVGSGSHRSQSPVPKLDSRHPHWTSNVIQYARQRAGKNLFRSDFAQEGFERTIEKVILCSHYPFSEETTVEFIDNIVDNYVRACAPEPFVIDLVSSDSSSISSTTLGSFANRNAQVVPKSEEVLPAALPMMPSTFDIRSYDFALESKAPYWKGPFTPKYSRAFFKLFDAYQIGGGRKSLVDMFTNDALSEIFNGNVPPRASITYEILRSAIESAYPEMNQSTIRTLHETEVAMPQRAKDHWFAFTPEEIWAYRSKHNSFCHEHKKFFGSLKERAAFLLQKELFFSGLRPTPFKKKLLLEKNTFDSMQDVYIAFKAVMEYYLHKISDNPRGDQDKKKSHSEQKRSSNTSTSTANSTTPPSGPSQSSSASQHKPEKSTNITRL